MVTAAPSSVADRSAADAGPPRAASSSAVAWGAILAGAAVAASLSLILLFLGTGLGLSSASPWDNEGIGAKTFGVSTILWISLTQVLAAGLGGYVAGRLRTRWLQVDVDEVYFRDTAHGLLTWAVATLATAALLGSAIGSILHSGLQAGATVAGNAASGVAAVAAANAEGPQRDDTLAYYVDSLFRRPAPVPAAPGEAETPQRLMQPATAPTHAEVTRIFLHTLDGEPISSADLSYVAQQVSEHSGLPPAEAEQRVRSVYADAQAQLRSAQDAARAAADEARKASAAAALWMFVALLMGAFVASLTATFGGRQRDQH
ncbi:MAG TPA: hypothetical protein VGE51_00595 [Fontimonas sp.]